MKKYLFLSYGFVTPTKEIQEAWGKWFESIGDKIVDGGSQLSAGREIAKDGTTKELPLGKDSMTGYMLFNAESMDEAEKIAKACPTITSARVYEAGSM